MKKNLSLFLVFASLAKFSSSMDAHHFPYLEKTSTQQLFERLQECRQFEQKWLAQEYKSCQMRWLDVKAAGDCKERHREWVLHHPPIECVAIAKELLKRFEKENSK